MIGTPPRSSVFSASRKLKARSTLPSSVSVSAGSQVAAARTMDSPASASSVETWTGERPVEIELLGVVLAAFERRAGAA